LDVASSLAFSRQLSGQSSPLKKFRPVQLALCHSVSRLASHILDTDFHGKTRIVDRSYPWNPRQSVSRFLAAQVEKFGFHYTFVGFSMQRMNTLVFSPLTFRLICDKMYLGEPKFNL
jgi:hypothetical protein